MRWCVNFWACSRMLCLALLWFAHVYLGNIWVRKQPSWGGRLLPQWLESWFSRKYLYSSGRFLLQLLPFISTLSLVRNIILSTNHGAIGIGFPIEFRAKHLLESSWKSFQMLVHIWSQRITLHGSSVRLRTWVRRSWLDDQVKVLGSITYDAPPSTTASWSTSNKELVRACHQAQYILLHGIAVYYPRNNRLSTGKWSPKSFTF